MSSSADQQQQQEQDQEQYNNSVRTISEKGIYEFEFVEGPKAGEKIRLERHKISNRMMRELEIERADYGSLLDKFANGKVQGISKEDRHNAAIMLTDLYAKMANCYFHISREDFDMMDWDSTKPNIDAAANVSVRGRPNLV